MSPVPTGRVYRTESGPQLEIKRHFDARVHDVWNSVTDSDETAKWIGRWSGTPGAGNTVQLQMGFEREAPVSAVYIAACDAPRRLFVTCKDDYGTWRIELTLQALGDATELTFTQHLEDTTSVGDVGPGWEYYLDMLVAARTSTSAPRFEDYYPAQREYYLKQAADA